MTIFDSLIERNKEFAADRMAKGGLVPALETALPRVRALIVGCGDMRADPAHILGVESGEALVLLNVGGRVTPGIVGMLGLLGRIGVVAGEKPGGGGEFHLIVLHHTDCGITRLEGDPEMLSAYFQLPKETLASKAVTDPRLAVKGDVAVLRGVPALPAAWIVSGLVYDVATGLVEIVVPPAPLRAT